MGLLDYLAAAPQAVKDRITGLVSDAAQGFGNTLLNKGTAADATGPGMEYKRYAAEQQSLGVSPLPYEQWLMMTQQK
jgi:hypothetical protein